MQTTIKNERQLSDQAQVAKLCKAYMKRRGIKNSCRSDSYSGGDSVHITIYNQPPQVKKELEREFSKYQYGHFDGMIDLYEYSNSRDDIPQTKYLFVDNEIDGAIYEAAYQFLRAKYPGNAASLPESYKDAQRQQWSSKDWNYDDLVECRVGRIVRGADFGLDAENSSEFWAEYNKPVPIRQPIDYDTISAHTTQELGQDVTVREGTRPGYVEILFQQKPDEEIRDSLKAAGFRWSRHNKCWYGKAQNLPDDYIAE